MRTNDGKSALNEDRLRNSYDAKSKEAGHLSFKKSRNTGAQEICGNERPDHRRRDL